MHETPESSTSPNGSLQESIAMPQSSEDRDSSWETWDITEPSETLARGMTATAMPSNSEFGMTAEARNFYWVKGIKDGKENKEEKEGRWSDTYPDHFSDPPENEGTAKYALLVWNRRSQQSWKKFDVDTIIVQSPLIKEALRIILEGYPTLNLNLDSIELRKSFEPFIHRWDRFEKLRAEEHPNPEFKKHLEILWNVLEGELWVRLRTLRDMVAHKTLEFDALYAIFEPGCLIFNTDEYAQDEKRDRVLRLRRPGYTSSKGCYSLDCEYLDWDGERFGWEDETLEIWPYSGMRMVSNLPSFPMAYHPKYEELKQRLVARGKVFEAHKGYHYKAYAGLGVQDTIEFQLKGRVVIDTDAYNQFNKQVYLRPMDWKKDGFTRPHDPKAPLTDEQHRHCSATLRAYAIADKKWLLIFVASLQDIAWDDTVFESLKRPDNEKEVIQTFAESQIKNEHQFTDHIQEKGKGMIMLFSGPSGVGKTFTAEAIAESLHCPLYVLSADELWRGPGSFVNVLQLTLTTATKWKCVVLLENVDTFLEGRNADTVAVFLSLMDQFRGFCILTTTNINHIEAPFKTRIHLTFQYKELDTAYRRHIWQNFLARTSYKDDKSGSSTPASKTIKFDNKSEMAELAKTPMNGREIRNVINAATLLAEKKGEDLGFGHLDTVIKLKLASANALMDGFYL